jgi:hypothetical protein
MGNMEKCVTHLQGVNSLANLEKRRMYISLYFRFKVKTKQEPSVYAKSM